MRASRRKRLIGGGIPPCWLARIDVLKLFILSMCCCLRAGPFRAVCTSVAPEEFREYEKTIDEPMCLAYERGLDGLCPVSAATAAVAAGRAGTMEENVGERAWMVARRGQKSISIRATLPSARKV